MTDIVQRTPEALAAKTAFDVANRIANNVRALRTLWVSIAEDLYRFHELEMWRDLGYVTFEAWLAEPMIDLGRRHVYYLLDAWRELVVKRQVERGQLEQIEMSRVQEVLPAIRRGHVPVDQALADARELGGNDLRDRYRGMGTTKPSAEAGSTYEATSEPEYAICPHCGSRYRTNA